MGVTHKSFGIKALSYSERLVVTLFNARRCAVRVLADEV
jgi:hypothetical protein